MKAEQIMKPDCRCSHGKSNFLFDRNIIMIKMPSLKNDDCREKNATYLQNTGKFKCGWIVCMKLLRKLVQWKTTRFLYLHFWIAFAYNDSGLVDHAYASIKYFSTIRKYHPMCSILIFYHQPCKNQPAEKSESVQSLLLYLLHRRICN